MQTRSLQLAKEPRIAERSGVLLIIGILLVAANLRSPITSLSPLIDLIRRDFPVSSAQAGFLTTLPLLAFAGLSPFVGKLTHRYGMERVVFAALLVMFAGSVIRQISGIHILMVGTLLVGLGIAMGNVILPGMIKKQFPHKLGIMTGSYSISMNLCGAAASAISVPIASIPSIGWRGTLLIIAAISLAALMMWSPQMKYNDKPVSNKNTIAKTKSVWRSGLAWHITIFMGMHSTVFYVFIAWLPQMLQSKGMTSTEAGYMLSVLQIAIMVTMFVVPIIAGRLHHQLSLVLFMAACMFLGLGGIMMSDGTLTLNTISVILVGIGGGTAFSLAIMFFGLRTRNAQETANLSGMAQSIGYLLAACGPFLFGSLHDKVGNWQLPMIILLVAAALLLITGISASRNKFIFGEE
jgi:CP family cyanate transporter-like MFS transporter